MNNLRNRWVKISSQLQHHRLDRCFIEESFNDPKNASVILAEMPDMELFASRKAKAKKFSEGLSLEIKFIGNEPLLTKEQEYHLFRKLNYLKFRISNKLADIDKKLNNFKIDALEKDIERFVEVKNQIVSSNTRLVISVAKRIKVPCDFQELVSEGMYGLVTAVNFFDYRRDIKFATYCHWVIKDKMLKYITQHFKFTNRIITNISSNISDEGDSILLDKVDPNYDEEVASRGRICLDEIIKVLPDKEKVVISGYFEDGQTLDVLGKRLGITRERVRQIKESGIRRLAILYKAGVNLQPLKSWM